MLLCALAAPAVAYSGAIQLGVRKGYPAWVDLFHSHALHLYKVALLPARDEVQALPELLEVRLIQFAPRVRGLLLLPINADVAVQHVALVAFPERRAPLEHKILLSQGLGALGQVLLADLRAPSIPNRPFAGLDCKKSVFFWVKVFHV